MTKNKKVVATIGVLGVLALGGASYAALQSDNDDANNEVTKTASAKSSSTSSAKKIAVTTYPTTAQTGDASSKVTVDLSKMKVTGSGVKVSDKTITISKGGTYYMTGSASDAQIVVDAGDKDEVTIIMNGVNLTSTTGPAIYEKNADKTIISSANNSINLIDGGTIADTAEEPFMQRTT